MKVTEITYGRSFQGGKPNGTWHKLVLTATVDRGEDPKDILDILRENILHQEKRIVAAGY